VVGHDYPGMYKSQLRERKQFKYPPFYRMIIVRIKHKRPELLNEAAKELGFELQSKFGNRVIGPEYPLVSRIKNMYIKQIILKTLRTDNQATVKKIIFNALDHFRKLSKYNSVIIQFDVDPM